LHSPLAFDIPVKLSLKKLQNRLWTVICLCQLSRQVESRQNKRPMLSDLRDSGAIEQDADGVLFLYRDDYYSGGSVDGKPSSVELTVAKNRHGQTGEDIFDLWLKYSCFKEAEQ